MHNDPIQQLAIEVRDAIAENGELKAALEQTKEADADDVGTFDVVISTGDTDRHGERIDQDGIDMTHFKRNPVVLFGHNHVGLPVGRADEVGVETRSGKKVTRAKGRFAPADANPQAQNVRKLFDQDILTATSVGIIVHEIKIGDGDDEKTLDRDKLKECGALGGAKDGAVINRDALKQKGILTKDDETITITKSELLEFSFVPVPANQHVEAIREAGYDPAELATKGLILAAQDEQGEPEATEGEETPAEGGETPENGAQEQEGTEEKGAVRDEVEKPEDPVNQKIDKMQDVFKVIDALIEVYIFNDDAAVGDFEKHVAEAAQILAEIANDTDGKKAATERSIHDRAAEQKEDTIKDLLAAHLTLRAARSKQDPDDPNAPEAVKKAGALFNDLNETVNDEIVKTNRKVLRLIGNALEGNDKAKDDTGGETDNNEPDAAPDTGGDGDNNTGAADENSGGSPGEDAAPENGGESPNKGSIAERDALDEAKTYFQVRDTVRAATTALNEALMVMNRNKPSRKGDHYK